MKKQPPPHIKCANCVNYIRIGKGAGECFSMDEVSLINSWVGINFDEGKKPDIDFRRSYSELTSDYFWCHNFICK